MKSKINSKYFELTSIVAASFAAILLIGSLATAQDSFDEEVNAELDKMYDASKNTSTNIQIGLDFTGEKGKLVPCSVRCVTCKAAYSLK